MKNKEAEKMGWRYEYIEGNGVDDCLWVSPNGKCFSELPENFRSEDLNLTEEQKEEGWRMATCQGNGYRRACGKSFKKLNWHTPTGCPHCNATFVD